IRGHGISEEELHTRINGVPNNEVIKYLFDGHCEEETQIHYSKLKEEYYRKFCREDEPSFHLVAGAEDFFDSLKEKKIPFTIASASIKENIDFFVESFHLDKWIDPETILYDDGTYASKIEMFEDASQVIGVPLPDCAIIEDSISGIQSAWQSGCRNIIVVDSANKRQEYEQLPGVVKVINTFEDL
ncbi:MAG: HAD family hydrolase, partial [Erysipelotrichaceae bacterium]|nr:HAD family hydrolase [Erysipelotrichaceae bacterium]